VSGAPTLRALLDAIDDFAGDVDRFFGQSDPFARGRTSGTEVVRRMVVRELIYIEEDES
jgi:hypothetical protein